MIATVFVMKINVEQGMVLHACNPSTWEAEAGGSQAQASLDYLARPCIKKKTLNVLCLE
jgi:hypothetical protein